MRFLATVLALAGMGMLTAGVVLTFGVAIALIVGGLLTSVSGLLLVDVDPRERRGKPSS